MPAGRPAALLHGRGAHGAAGLGGPLVYNSAQGVEDPSAILLLNTKGPDLRCTNPADPSTCTLPIQLACDIPQGETQGVCSNNRQRSCSRASDCFVEPLVLRAAANECIQVTLYNGIDASAPGSQTGVPITPALYPANCAIGNAQGTNCGGAAQPRCCQEEEVAAKATMSVEVGLRPQLVTYDLRASDGTNAGFNPIQTVRSCGQGTPLGQCSNTTYTWYAGQVDRDPATGGVSYIPIEFGASNLLSPDPINQYVHGLFGGLIIEPQGARFEEGAGSSAVVSYSDPENPGIIRRFREFVVFMQDDTNNLPGQVNAVNYRTENLFRAVRRCTNQCAAADVSCVLAGESFQRVNSVCQQRTFTPATPVFMACAGDSIRIRLLHGGGTNTANVFELAGHNFSEQPYMTPREFCDPPLQHTNFHASPRLGTENLCGSREFTSTDVRQGQWRASLNEWKGARQGHGPSNHFDVLIDKAGGPFEIPGDYLYRSAPAMHFNRGLWGLLRVVPPAQPQGLTCLSGPGDQHDLRLKDAEDPPPPPSGGATGAGERP